MKALGITRLSNKARGKNETQINAILNASVALSKVLLCVVMLSVDTMCCYVECLYYVLLC